MLHYFSYLLAYLPLDLQPCETVQVRGVWAVGTLFNSSGATPTLFCPLAFPSHHLPTNPPQRRVGQK